MRKKIRGKEGIFINFCSPRPCDLMHMYPFQGIKALSFGSHVSVCYMFFTLKMFLKENPSGKMKFELVGVFLP